MDDPEEDKARLELVSSLACCKQLDSARVPAHANYPLKDHAEIIRERTDAIRNGISSELVQIRKTAESPKEARAPAGDQTSLAQLLQVNRGLLRDDAFITSQLVVLLRNGIPEALEGLLMHLPVARSRDETRTIVNMTAEGGETPLMISASQGLDSVVDLLLDFGADPNAAGAGDQTALHLTTDAGFFTPAQKLVSRGTDTPKSRCLQENLLERARIRREDDPDGSSHHLIFQDQSRHSYAA